MKFGAQLCIGTTGRCCAASFAVIHAWPLTCDLQIGLKIDVSWYHEVDGAWARCMKGKYSTVLRLCLSMITSLYGRSQFSLTRWHTVSTINNLFSKILSFLFTFHLITCCGTRLRIHYIIIMSRYDIIYPLTQSYHNRYTPSPNPHIPTNQAVTSPPFPFHLLASLTNGIGDDGIERLPFVGDAKPVEAVERTVPLTVGRAIG